MKGLAGDWANDLERRGWIEELQPGETELSVLLKGPKGECTKLPRWMVPHLQCALRKYRVLLLGLQERVAKAKAPKKPQLEQRLAMLKKERERVKILIYDRKLQWPISTFDGLSDAYKREHVVAFKLDCGDQPRLLLQSGPRDIFFSTESAAPEEPTVEIFDPKAHEAMQALLAEYVDDDTDNEAEVSDKASDIEGGLDEAASPDKSLSEGGRSEGEFDGEVEADDMESLAEDQEGRMVLILSMVKAGRDDLSLLCSDFDEVDAMADFSHFVTVKDPSVAGALMHVIRKHDDTYKRIVTEKVVQSGIPDGLPEFTSIWRRHVSTGVERWRCKYPHRDVFKVRLYDNHTETGPGSYDRVVKWLVETHAMVQALGE